MEQFYSVDVELSNFNFRKIKHLYGILKGFKRNDTYFTIQTKSGKFTLSTCSFLILLSLIGINENVEIRLIGKNLKELNNIKRMIKEI